MNDQPGENEEEQLLAALAELPLAEAASPDLAADALLSEGAPDPLLSPEAADFPAPGENSDPALAVEEMLSAAVLPETGELLAESVVDFSATGAGPNFQLQLLSSSPESLKQWQGLTQKHGLHHSLTQLTEYQALALRQEAHSLGLAVKVHLNFPLPALTEEEQALGDLAAVPEPTGASAEGAPHLALPAGEREVMVLLDALPGLQLKESLGLISTHRSIARRFFREEEMQEDLKREGKKMGTASQALPASRWEQTLKEILLDLQKMALQKGGNALVGLRLESFSETSHLEPNLDQIRLVAFAVAAVVEKA